MPPIDVSIYQNLLRPPKSVAEYDAEAMQGQQNRLALQMGQQKADEYTRSVSDGNKLRQVVSGFGADKGANYNALLQSGRLPEAQAYAKQNADIEKTGADVKHLGAQTAKLDLEAVGLASQQHKDMLGAVGDPQTAAQWVTAAYNDPRLAAISAHGGTLEQAIARIPTDPAKFQDWKMQSSLGADKLIEYTRANANTVATNATSAANNAATNETSRANNTATVGATIRGQNMADRRAAETNQNSRGVIIQTDTGPMLANTRTGATQQIIGPDGKPVTRTKPLTEFQGKSAAFGDRAMAADKILGELGANYSPAAINSKNAVEGTPLIGGAMGAITNKFALSENDQRAEQAQRDFINAVLRQESGAAIGANEFDNARKQYFPQPGDKPKNIAQKAANRKLVIEGFKRSAGANAEFTPVDSAPADIHAQAAAILAGNK